MTKKYAVLVSGGMDSFVAYRLAVEKFGKQNVIGIFINYGQPYLEKEIKAVDELFDVGNITFLAAQLCLPSLDNIPTVDKQEIFGRNLLLAFYGAVNADVVWMSVLENELHHSVPDKHPEFFHMCSALFTYTFKNRRNETLVETPFAELTKSEVVRLGLLMGITKEQFLKTVSCYEADAWGKNKSCGKCLACFKRWVAWSNNGIEEEFEVPPWMETWNPYAHKVLPIMREYKCSHPHYSAPRVRETHNALINAKLPGIFNTSYLSGIHEGEPELIRWAEWQKTKKVLLNEPVKSMYDQHI